MVKSPEAMQSEPESEVENTPQETVEIFDSEKQEQEKLIADFLKVQLRYAVKLHKQEIPQLNGKKEPLGFEEAIINNTRLSKKIENAYREKTGYQGDVNYDETYKAVMLKILSDIHYQYDQNPDTNEWIEKVDECIAGNVDGLPKSESVEKFVGEHGQVGIIKYNVIDDPKMTEVFFKAGVIAENSVCIEIHFAPIFMQKSKQENRRLAVLSIKSALKDLAALIKEKHPEAEAVIGESWLLDTSLAKKLGFTVLDNRSKPRSARGHGFWGQFIDENGNMREDKVQQLLETGTAEHDAKAGYILTEEFLKLYN